MAVFTGIKHKLFIKIALSDIIPILILGLVNAGIGCYFYFSSIGKLPVQTVSVCVYLEPLSAVVFSVLFLNETMLTIQIIEAVLIIGGAVLGELFRTEKIQHKDIMSVDSCATRFHDHSRFIIIILLNKTKSFKGI